MDSLKIENLKVRFDQAICSTHRQPHSPLSRTTRNSECNSSGSSILLGTDRVKIYKFHSDGSGEVIAESINGNRLPSLLGLHFPADVFPLTPANCSIRLDRGYAIAYPPCGIEYDSCISPDAKRCLFRVC